MTVRLHECLQATIRSPSTTNIYKALALQFTIGSIPFFVITLVGYWAYGNAVYPYLLINLSGPKWAITFANVAALLQAIIVFFVSLILSNYVSSNSREDFRMEDRNLVMQICRFDSHACMLVEY